MLEMVTNQLDQAKISEEPFHLKNSMAHIKLRKNRLYNLTPQQMELLASNKKTILMIGAAGTGKTIMTKLKILKQLRLLCCRACARTDKTVMSMEEIVVFVPENMINEYKQFVENNAPDTLGTGENKEDLRSFIHFYSLSREDYLENLRVALQRGVSILIDDSQHFYQFQRMFTLKELLNKWRSENPEKLLWIALDWFQFIINGPLGTKFLTIPDWVFPGAAFYLDLIIAQYYSDHQIDCPSATCSSVSLHIIRYT